MLFFVFAGQEVDRQKKMKKKKKRKKVVEKIQKRRNEMVQVVVAVVEGNFNPNDLKCFFFV